MALSVATRNLKFMQRAAAKKGAPITEELPRGAIQAEEDAKWVMPSRRAVVASQSSEAGPSRLGGRIQVTWESSYMPFIGSAAHLPSDSSRSRVGEDDDEDLERSDGPSQSFAGGGRMRFGYAPDADANGSKDKQEQHGDEDDGMSDDGGEEKERPLPTVRREKKPAATSADTSVRPTPLRVKQETKPHITSAGLARPSNYIDHSTPKNGSAGRTASQQMGSSGPKAVSAEEEGQARIGATAPEKKMTAAERMRATIAGNRSKASTPVSPAAPSAADSRVETHPAASGSSSTQAAEAESAEPGTSSSKKNKKRKKRPTDADSTLPSTTNSSAAGTPASTEPKKPKHSQPASAPIRVKEETKVPPPTAALDLDARERELKAVKKREKKARQKAAQ